MIDMTIITEAQAKSAGAEAGKNAGSWVIDGNTTIETCRRILAGYNDGDPEIMDMQPSPLSGEHAGSSIPEIFGDPEPTQEIMDAYEQAFTDAYWDTVLDAVRYHLPEDDHTLE